ncbi:Cytoplasmic dynein 1 light intermediate chain 2 [Liparis tanakae]|uniref:Dynein light intermediate chain n=1 Tax=Liparis tanakae TaxID=230148 RepID=A0A4Z2ISA7_9TELE|nr:Cytoplasmic dynein 1 light intermediate chain 2 [Liparis tanakae]
MAKLQGADHNKRGRGLEYLYLNVHDEDRDDLTRCNVWILDGDLYHKGLLKFAISAQSLADCLAVFVVDMSRPWTIMESLQKWASVLRDHLDKLKISPEDTREMEQKMVKAFQEYTEPEEAAPSSPQRPGAANEGVLANFFNSLLSKKTGAPGSPGSPAVGAGVQGSAKKTGQKPGLTDVQAELDRMTRKQDSEVSTNNIPAPTENEASGWSSVPSARLRLDSSRWLFGNT